MKRWWSMICSVLLLCGCTMQEVSDRIPVSAAALDVQGDKLLLTAQTVTIAGTDAEPETERQSVVTGSVTQGMNRSGHLLFWTAMETAVLDEQLVQTGLLEPMQELLEEPSVRPAIRLCVARGCTGREILEAEDSADGLTTLLDDAVEEGRAINQPLYQTQNARLTAGIDPALPVLRIEQGSVRTSGTAVFRGDTLCGYLGEQETAAFALLRGDTHRMFLYDAEGNRMALTGVTASVKVSTDGAQISVRGKLLDSSEERVQRAAGQCREISMELVNQLQRWNSDALGLGRELYRTHPKDFSAADWAARYPTLPVSVTVRLTRTQGGSPQ